MREAVRASAFVAVSTFISPLRSPPIPNIPWMNVPVVSTTHPSEGITSMTFESK